MIGSFCDQVRIFSFRIIVIDWTHVRGEHALGDSHVLVVKRIA